MIRLIVSFLAGILVKIVDLAEDNGLKINRNFKVLLGAAYGFLLSYLILIAPLPSFWIGILIGILLAGKIDSEGHYIGFGFALLLIILNRLPVINPVILILTVLVTIFEEWINDEIVDKKKVKGTLKMFLSLRPMLEITSIILAVIYSNIYIFLMLLMFDTGYVSAKKFFYCKQ